MCDEGRFGFRCIQHPERLKQPRHRKDGMLGAVDWDDVLPLLRGALSAAVARDARGVAAVLSPWMSCEEAYLAAKYLKGLAPEVRLALGPVRTVGEDDRYPKDIHGRPVEPAKFVIRAEKCPNRRGVELILKHLEGRVVGWDEVLAQVGSGTVHSLHLFGGDREPWITAEQAGKLAKLEFLAVQDILPSPASAVAHIVLPGGAFAEREGTFVNHAGLAQAIQRAIVPPEEAWPDGRILWELAGRRGLFHAPTLRQEMAHEIPALRPLASGELGEYGVFVSER
jgi:NADH-quinone oxidoreductase subunit G